MCCMLESSTNPHAPCLFPSSAAHLPPVPKFPSLQNSFASSKRTSARPPPTEPKKEALNAPSTPTNPNRTAKSLSRSPSKSAPSITSPLSKSPFARLGSQSPLRDRTGQSGSDGSPSPSKKKRRVEELGGAEYADDGGLGMDVDFGPLPDHAEDGDRTIRLGEDGADDDEHGHHGGDGAHGHGEDDEDEEEDFWTRDEMATVSSTLEHMCFFRFSVAEPALPFL